MSENKNPKHQSDDCRDSSDVQGEQNDQVESSSAGIEGEILSEPKPLTWADAVVYLRSGIIAGGAAALCLLLSIVVIIPVFEKISSSQAWVFEMLGYYVLTPIILLTAFAFLPWWDKAESNPSDADDNDGDAGNKASPGGALSRLTLIDLAMLIWFIVKAVGVFLSSWPLVANFHRALTILAFYAAWRIGLPAFASQKNCAVKAGAASIPGNLAWALAVLGGLFSLQALLLGFGVNPFALINRAVQESAERGSLLTILGHPNYLGSAIVLLFFLKLSLFYRRPDTACDSSMMRSFVLAELLLLDLAALFVIGARGATLAIIAGCLVASVMTIFLKAFSQRARRWILGSSLMLFLAVLGLMGWAWTQGSQRSAANSAKVALVRSSLATRMFSRSEGTTRLHTYLSSLGLFIEKPFLGQGPGAYDVAYWDLLGRHLQAGTEGTDESARGGKAAPPMALVADEFLIHEISGLNPGHTHNEILHAGAETGALGILALLLLAAAALSEAWRSRSIFLAGALAAFAVDSQFNFPLHLPVSSCLLALILAALSTASESRAMEASKLGDASSASSFNNRFLALGLFSLVLAVGWLTGPGAVFKQFTSRLLHRQAATAVDPEFAYKQLEKAIEANPANLAARRELVDADISRGRTRKALNEAVRLVEESRHPFDYFRLAEARLQGGEELEAAQLFELVCRMAPRHLPTAERRLLAVMQIYSSQIAKSARMDRETATLLIEMMTSAIDHLRTLDYRHPLAYYTEGVMEQDVQAFSPALSSFRAAQQELARRFETDGSLSDSDRALSANVEGRIEALKRLRSQSGS